MIMNNKWKNISINQYKELSNVNTIENPLDRTIAILSILNKVDDTVYYNMSLSDLGKEVGVMEFLKESPKPELKNKIKLNDITYKLNDRVDKWTAGQYIDYMNVITHNDINYGLCMAILYTPKGKGYGEGYDVLEAAETFNNECPIEYALGISDFFFKLLTSLTETTLLSLKKQMEKVMKKEPEKAKELQKVIEAVNQIYGSL